MTVLTTREKKEKQSDDNSKQWIAYWRSNPHKFVSEYLQIHLFSLFQKMLIYIFSNNINNIFWGSRGISKSYLTCLFACVRCILYPGTKVVIAASTKGQASKIVLKKIPELQKLSPNLSAEIEKVHTSIQEAGVTFKNGSTITVVAANEGARGTRAHIIVIDEFRTCDKKILDTVIIPFLTGTRTPGFISNPKYKNMVEGNIEVYLSSAGYKSEWSYKDFILSYREMISGGKYFTIGLPYHYGLKEGILNHAHLAKEKRKLGKMIFDMEYGCLPYGETENAFFHYEELSACRNLKKPLLPMSDESWAKHNGNIKKNPFWVEKQPGEIRVMGVDVALMASSEGGNNNDATAITVLRCLPEGSIYSKQLVYTENMEGKHTFVQTKRIKEIFYDLECDYIALDTNGNGMSIYDEAVKVTENEERGIEYPAWTAMNNEKMNDRSIFDKNAVPVIYSVKVAGGGAALMNHEMAVYTKTNIEKKQLRLLVNEEAGSDYAKTYLRNKKVSNQDESNRLNALYILTTISINEMINLETILSGGLIKLKEKSGNRKDRYSSLSYALFFIKSLEADLINRSGKTDIKEWGKVLGSEARFNSTRKSLY